MPIGSTVQDAPRLAAGAPAEAPPPSRETPVARFAALFLCLALSIGLTLLLVQYSLRWGCRILAPEYDDVNYMFDGLRWLDAFYANGLPGVLQAMQERLPQSPFSSALACLSYLLFGAHDWSVNAGNGLIVLTYLLFLNLLLGAVPLVRRAALLVLAATVPLAGAAIFHFRPDIMCGILTAIAVTTAIWGGALVHKSATRALAFGALMAASLWTKPSVFVMTLVIVIGTFLVSLLAEWVADRRGLALRKTLTRGFLAALAMVLIAAPHYYKALGTMWRYMWDNIFGKDRQQWELVGTFKDHATFYLTGYGGTLMLGRHLWLCAAIVLVGLVWAALWWDRTKACRLAGVVAMAVAIYAMVSINKVKNEFFGITFQVLLVAAALLVVAEFLQAASPSRLRTAFAWSLALLGLWFFQVPPRWGMVNDPIVVANRRVTEQIHELLLQKARPGQRVMVTTQSHLVNPSVLTYLDLRDRGAMPWYDDRYFIDPSPGFKQELDSSDFLVASEPGTGTLFEGLPRNKFEAAWLQAVRDRPDYREIGHFVGNSPKGFFVFEHRRAP